MKKILALILALLMVVFAFAACGKKTAPESDETLAATGEKGEKGDKGDKGDQGIQGIQGAQGIQGIQGVQGEKGDAGKDGRSIHSVEIKDGFLWITYTDDLENPVNVGAVTVQKPDTKGFEYQLLPDGTYAVTGLTDKNFDKIEIPATYDGKAVTQIAANAFKATGGLIEVIIPDSVTSIGEGAFNECVALSRIVIPDSVSIIGKDAFRFCINLTEIELPKSVESIGSGAFNSCAKLVSIDIPNKVTVINSDTFHACGSLTSVTIHNNVTRISSQAFMGCSSLKNITIPQNVTNIGYDAFKNCTQLEAVTFANTEAWSAGENDILDTDLNDTAKAATLLKDTYCDLNWSKTFAYDMENVSDTVYVLYNANIRKDASLDSEVEILATVPFGKVMERSQKNDMWSKVTYVENGSSITGYIANDLITIDSKAVTFVEQKNGDGTAVVTAVKTDLGGANNIIVRKCPLANGYPNSFTVLESESFNEGSIVGQIAKGTPNITVLAVSEDGKWAYIKGQGILFENGEPETLLTTTVEGYTLYSNLVISDN